MRAATSERFYVDTFGLPRDVITLFRRLGSPPPLDFVILSLLCLFVLLDLSFAVTLRFRLFVVSLRLGPVWAMLCIWIPLHLKTPLRKWFRVTSGFVPPPGSSWCTECRCRSLAST